MPSAALAEQYSFADFTHARYRDLLRLAKRTWTFRSFTDYSPEERFVLWRHDIDFSPHAARNLAQIEAEEGVQSTYFVHLHSEFYNALERDSVQQLREITDRGHHIGLHFDVHFHDVTDEVHLDAMIADEAAILRRTLGVPVESFSFHITNDFTMACQRPTYGGLVNAYGAYFRNEVGYCSDSNGYWRFRRLHDVLTAATDTRLQVLTHDAWWQETVMSPRARVYRSITGRAAKTARYHADLIASCNRITASELHDVFGRLRQRSPAYAGEVEMLWFAGKYVALLAELGATHARQLRALAGALVLVPIAGGDGAAAMPARSARLLLEQATEVPAAEVTGVSDADDASWRSVLAAAADGERTLDAESAEPLVEAVIAAIQRTAAWGAASPAQSDGLGFLPPHD